MAIPTLFASANINQIIQLITLGIYGSQQIRNVYHAVIDNPPTAWASPQGIDILQNAARVIWEDIVVPVHRELALNTMTYQGVKAVAPDDDSTDYWQSGIDSTYSDETTGAIGGDGMTTFDAFGMRLNAISSGLVGVGYKRWAGVPETRQNGGIAILDPTMEIALDDFEVFMIGVQNVTIPGVGAFDMAMLIPKTEAFMVDGKKLYRTVGGFRVADTSFRSALTSQNSRKRGVGI